MFHIGASFFKLSVHDCIWNKYYDPRVGGLGNGIWSSYLTSMVTFNWNITKEKSKQNIIRDFEIRNNVTIARGEWGGDSGDRGLQELL